MDNQKLIERLAFDSGGSGPPALFVHGFGSSKFTWRYLCRGLKDIYTYIAIDLPGSGDSPAPQTYTYSIENFATLIRDYILASDLKNLTLVTHSYAAGIVLFAMIRDKAHLANRIAALCIIDGICYPQRLPFYVGILRVPLFGYAISEIAPAMMQARSVLKECYFNDALITADQIETYAKYLGRPEVREALRKTAQLIDQETLSTYVPLFNQITTPTLLIWGREDQVVPLQHGTRLAGTLPHAELEIINECGHMPQEERPDRVIEKIRRFHRQFNK